MPNNDLFQTYMQDAVSFSAVLYHAARHLAKTQQGIPEATLQALRFQRTSMDLLYKRLSARKGSYDDGTIIAVGLIANTEVSPELVPIFEICLTKSTSLGREGSSANTLGSTEENDFFPRRLSCLCSQSLDAH